MPEYDPSLTIYVLNMLIISLNRIILSKDRRTLDREYTNIISNLNFNENQIEPEIMSLFREISHVIGNKRLNDKIRQAIASTDSQREQENSFVRNIKRWFSNARDSFLEDFEKWSVHPVISSIHVTLLATQKNNNELELNQEELKEYYELQNKLLTASLELMRKHELRGIIREKNLRDFTKALSVENPKGRQLLLENILRDFSEYAPYWFYRAEASIEVGDYKKADEYLKKFIDLRKPVFIQDIFMAEAMKYKIGILMHNGVNYRNVEEILSCLSEMIAHASQDWTIHLFAGTTYFSLGRKDEAIKHVSTSMYLSHANEEIQKILERMETDEVPPRIEPLSDEEFVNLCEAGDARNVEEALMLGANPNAKKEGRTALICAIRGAKISTKIVELLLKYGAYVNAMDEDGRMALIIAVVDVHYGKEQVVKLLLKYGAYVNAVDKKGRTALIIAVAHYGTDEVVELLLNYRANVNAKDNAGITALMIAANHGKTQVVKLLLSKGADINAKDSDGSTVLMWAGNVEIAELLLNNEADVNARDNNGMTALMHADDERVAELLLNNKADVNAKNNVGMTALMIAANHGKTQVVKLLLDKGADVNIRDENGMTALMLAGNVKVAELLLDSEAKVNVRDKNGMTALMHAAGDVLIAELLLDSGANINAKDKKGMTALMLAVKENYPDFEWLLRDHGAK